MVTCYDYTSAKLVDKANIDAVLVGDSYSMVVSGHNNTVPATLEGTASVVKSSYSPEMIYHCKAVSRGICESMVVGDLPFGSYEVCDEDAVRSGIRLMKEGAVDSVKLEGGTRVQSRVRALVNAGIPVMGHIGLTPQTLSSLGGFKVQGNTLAKAGILSLSNFITTQ
jgi:3-methyl-2-oxobutanoate hydroxymethyltransferase